MAAGRDMTESAYLRFTRQAITALKSVRGDIRAAEAKLADLRKQEEWVARVAGQSAAPGAASLAPGGAAAPHGRTDWRAVLETLPRRFTAADVRRALAPASKQPSEVFTAVTRWIDRGMVKRKERGVYERVK